MQTSTRPIGVRQAFLALLESNWAILVVTAVGLLMRLAGSVVLPIPPEDGDQAWYLNLARNIAENGMPSVDVQAPFARPPSLSIFIVPFLLLFGASYRIPLMIALGVMSSSSILLAARLTRRVAPRLPTAPMMSALLVAFSPYEIQLARYVMTEALITPIFIAYMHDCIAAEGRMPLGRAIRLALYAAAMLHLRLDAVLLVAGPAVGVVMFSLLRRAPFGPLARSWALVAGLTGLLCVPYSLFASARTGRVVILAEARSLGPLENGLTHWLAVTRIPEPIWFQASYAYVLGRIEPESIPDFSFDSPEQHDVARKLLALSRDAHGPIRASEEFFERIAHEHSTRWETWTILPLERAVALWYDFGRYHMHGRPRFDAVAKGAFRSILDAWVSFYAFLLALGFTLAVASVFRRRTPAFVLAVSVLVKTFGQLYTGILHGAALMEIRYQVSVQILAFVLVAVVAARLAELVLVVPTQTMAKAS